MIRFRREFLKAGAATAIVGSLPTRTIGAAVRSGPWHGIANLFDDLPGDLGLKIHVPSHRDRSGFSVQVNSGKVLFAASAIKTFALCKALQQAEEAAEQGSPDIDHALETKELSLDASVWSLGSPIFNPPHLSGMVSERTALEAMILRSDNTATDMIFKLVGVDNIRELIASAGLLQTRVPDSTRIFAAYLFGAKDYETITWDELLKLASEGVVVNPFLNDVQTLASTAQDFVTYYSQALQGRFFRHGETLQEFRRILTLCDFIYLIPLPLGVSAYAKSGNADAPGFHARAFAGGMFVGDRWAYFAFILNWDAPEVDDSRTVGKFFAAINDALTRTRDFMT